MSLVKIGCGNPATLGVSLADRRHAHRAPAAGRHARAPACPTQGAFKISSGTNDNQGRDASACRDEPDAHGQAALLFAEAILHALIQNGTLTNTEALAAVQSAAEVKVEVAALAGESRQRMEESLALLARIGMSIEIDSA